MERRLSAILAADVVGYSRLMEQDEADTFERLRTLRKEVLEPEVAAYHGHIFKLTGDGFLAEFPSVIDAVECAAVVQTKLAEKNAAIEEDLRIDVRMGINIGEVIVEGDDRYGEGVNIAARLQELADPGGIWVSAKVAGEVGKKLPFELESVGAQHLKNMDEPIGAFRVNFDKARNRARVKRRNPLRRMARRWTAFAAGVVGLAALAGFYLLPTTNTAAESPAIAVLPFENINGDEKWGRFANGITEDIITDLARYRDLSVIARTSTEAYRDKSDDVREIGKALGVKYVLEGSLQVDGHRLRVTAQLINAETGVHVWSERYDRLATELLEVQDEITQKIAITLTGWQGQVTEAERTRTQRKNATDLNAYDFWLLGIEAKHRMTVESLLQARSYFEKGLKLAPDFMPLVRDMGITYALEFDVGSTYNYPASLKAIRKFTERALELDANDSTTNFMMGVVYNFDGNEEQGERYMNLARQFGPNNADTMMLLAFAYSGWQTERANELVEQTLKLNPRYPAWWNFPITYTYFAARRFDKAFAAAKQAGESANQAALVAMSAAQLGKTQEASDAAATVLRLKPDWTAESMYPYQTFSDETLIPESASKAKLPVCMSAVQSAAYSGLYRFKQCEEERTKAAVN